MQRFDELARGIVAETDRQPNDLAFTSADPAAIADAIERLFATPRRPRERPRDRGRRLEQIAGETGERGGGRRRRDPFTRPSWHRAADRRPRARAYRTLGE